MPLLQTVGKRRYISGHQPLFFWSRFLPDLFLRYLFFQLLLLSMLSPIVGSPLRGTPVIRLPLLPLLPLLSFCCSHCQNILWWGFNRLSWNKLQFLFPFSWCCTGRTLCFPLWSGLHIIRAVIPFSTFGSHLRAVIPFSNFGSHPGTFLLFFLLPPFSVRAVMLSFF